MENGWKPMKNEAKNEVLFENKKTSIRDKATENYSWLKILNHTFKLL